jgi:hypothetical protein
LEKRQIGGFDKMPLYPKYEIALGAQATNTNLLTGIVKMVLVTSVYVYSATHEFLSDVSVPSRVGTSTSLTNKIYTGGVFQSDPIYFPSLLALEAVATVLFIDTGVASTSRLIFYNNQVQGFPTTPAANSDATIYPAGYLFSLDSGGGGGAVVWGSITGTLSSQTDLLAALNAKQSTLVSGTNLKTVNGQTLLGTGDVTITGGSGAAWGGITGTLSNQADLQAVLNTFAISSHGHIIGNITGLQTALDAKATVVSVTTVSNDLAALTTVVAGKQNTLGFTAENIANKSTVLTSPDNTKYPTTQAVSNALTAKSDTGHTHLLSAITNVTATATEINYSIGVTSAIQTQLNSKQAILISATNIKTVNGQTLLGSGDVTVTGGAVVWGGITGTLSSQADLQTALDAKQATLISATNIKTVNGQTLLGSGDVTVTGGVAWGNVTGTLGSQTDLQNALNLKAPLANPAFTGTVTGITKAMVGLSAVENTALSTWAGSSSITTLGTVVTGIWNGTAIGDVYISSASIWNAKQNALGFSPENITNKSTSLASPDNTKYPTTLAVSSAISGFAPLASPTFTGTVAGVTKAMVGLPLVENTALSTWTGSANLTTLGTITGGTWNGIAIGDAYISSASAWNAKQDALVSAVTIKTINEIPVLGSGNISISGSGLSQQQIMRLAL